MAENPHGAWLFALTLYITLTFSTVRVTVMTTETDRQLALRVLRDTLRDSDAKPSERVSAAKLLLEHDAAKGAGPGALHALQAAELLAIARGEGDTPPAMGPVGVTVGAVPSAAREVAKSESPPAPAKRLEVEATPEPPTAAPADPLGRTPGAFLKKGPKKSPPNSLPPGGTSPMGPKTDPAISLAADPLS